MKMALLASCARALCVVVLALRCGCTELGSQVSSLRTRQSDFSVYQPAVRNYVWRIWHSSIVLGSYLYIEGGETQQQLDNGTYVNGSVVQDTLSIDLTKSWTAESVDMHPISKRGLPFLNGQSLWPAKDNQSFYSFGGHVSLFGGDTDNVPDIAAYQFLVGGNGDGTWVTNTSGADPLFQSLFRPVGMKSGTIRDTTFFFGGWYSSRSTPRVSPGANGGSNDRPLPGFLSYNATTGVWKNDSSPIPWNGNTDSLGIAAAVPSFGPQGLFITAVVEHDENVNLGAMNNITIYDPASRGWKWQPATGTVPAGRGKACTVGIQGDNGTYEVFVYGGRANLDHFYRELSDEQKQADIAFDSVFVLSLPGFVWFKADYPSTHPRYLHTCNVIGNRQMVSIGGKNPQDWAGRITRDPLPQGLGIFDLTEMKWTDGFDPTAAPYKTPDVVKNWYNNNPISAIKWQDPTLKTYFVEDHARVPTPTTEASSPSSAGASSFSTPSSPNKGAIAGSVVGGVAGFATVAVISWFFLRRRRRTQQVTTEAEANPCGGESCYNGQPSEMAATPYRMELHGGRGGAEAWEMDGSVRHVERDHHTQPRQEIDGTMVG